MDQTQTTAQATAQVTAQVLFMSLMGKVGYCRIGWESDGKGFNRPIYWIRKDRVPPEVWDRWKSLKLREEVTVVHNPEPWQTKAGETAYHIIDIL